MSTLKVTNIQDTSGGNSATTEQIYKGISKAWVNFDGVLAGTRPFTSSGGIRASFNVSSITYNRTGDYTVNFTTSMMDSNFSCICTTGNPDGETTNKSIGIFDIPNSSSARFLAQSSNGNNVNLSFINVSIFR